MASTKNTQAHFSFVVAACGQPGPWLIQVGLGLFEFDSEFVTKSSSKHR